MSWKMIIINWWESPDKTLLLPKWPSYDVTRHEVVWRDVIWQWKMTSQDVTWCCMTWRHMRMKDVIWCCMTWRHMRIEDVTWCCVTWRHGTYKKCDVVWRDVTWVWMMWCCMTWRHVTMNDVMLCDVTSCDYERSVMMLCIVMLSDIPPTVYQIKLMYLIASSFLTPKLYWVNCNGILIKCLFNYTCLSDFT